MYISMLEFITNCFVAHCLFISLCGCLKFDRSWFCYWCVILNKWSLNTWYHITAQSMQIIYVYNKRNLLLLLFLWLDFLFNFINEFRIVCISWSVNKILNFCSTFVNLIVWIPSVLFGFIALRSFYCSDLEIDVLLSFHLFAACCWQVEIDMFLSHRSLVTRCW